MDPCAFLRLWDTPYDIHPVIFDTGALLAITHSLSDFDGPLSIPKGDLHLGGMANGMCIEGLGSITWNFLNKSGTNVCVQGMASHVPEAKDCLLSPQCLFDTSTGLKGHYEWGSD